MNKVENLETTKLRGLTLIEGLLFLGLAAVVFISVIGFFANGNNQNKVNTASQQIQSYIASVNSLFSNTDSFSSLSDELIIAAGKAPTGAVKSSTELRNPWGGDTNLTGDADAFYIEMDALPIKACTTLVTANLLDASSVFALSVNSGGGDWNLDDGDTPPTPGDAMAACSSDLNSIMLSVR